MRYLASDRRPEELQLRSQALLTECRSAPLYQNVLFLKVPKAEGNEEMGSRQAFCLLPWLGEMCWAGSVGPPSTAGVPRLQCPAGQVGLGAEEVTVVALIYNHWWILELKQPCPISREAD